MSRYLTDIRLGDLLSKTGIVSAKQVDDAVKTAANKNLHFGQILVMSGYLKSSDLTAGIEAQSAIRDKVVDRSAAAKALECACRDGVKFDEALATIGAAPNSAPTNRLGELLIDSGLLTPEQCKFAIDRSLSTGLPLGRILVTNNLLTEDTLVDLLEIQLRVRDELITRKEALELIATGPERVQHRDLPQQRTIRLGELLVRANILTRTDVINALEVGMHANEKIGQLLVGFGFISIDVLESALSLQQMVDNNFLRIEQAAKCLKYVEANNCTISEALVKLNILNLPKAGSQGDPRETLGSGSTQSVNRFSESTQSVNRFSESTQSVNRFINATDSRVGSDSTFGDADQTSWNSMDYRTRRLVRSLRSAADARELPPELCTAYSALAKTYLRLADRHFQSDNLIESEWLYERVLALKERVLGRSDIKLAFDLKRLADIQVAQKKFGAAERTIRRAIALLEKGQPYNGALLAISLNMLAMIYFEQGFFNDAEPLLTRALTLKELHCGADKRELADTMRDYARLLAKTGRSFEAEKLYFQARSLMTRSH